MSPSILHAFSVPFVFFTGMGDAPPTSVYQVPRPTSFSDGLMVLLNKIVETGDLPTLPSYQLDPNSTYQTQRRARANTNTNDNDNRANNGLQQDQPNSNDNHHAAPAAVMSFATVMSPTRRWAAQLLRILRRDFNNNNQQHQLREGNREGNDRSLTRAGCLGSGRIREPQNQQQARRAEQQENGTVMSQSRSMSHSGVIPVMQLWPPQPVVVVRSVVMCLFPTEDMNRLSLL